MAVAAKSAASYVYSSSCHLTLLSLSFNNKLKFKNTDNSGEIAVFYIINLIEKPLIGCQFPKTVKFEDFTPVAHKGIKRKKNKEKI